MTAKVEGSIRGYGDEIARDYDEKSRLDKGDREAQRAQVIDLVRRLRPQPERMIDIGAGTGFFSGALLEAFPGAQVVCIDGSAEMLAVAERGLSRWRRASFMQARFEGIDWERLGSGYDVIFSALAIHHLEDEAKWQLFRDIGRALAPGGVFILIDQFREPSREANELLEYLSCMDIKRRICAELGVDEDSPDVDVETLIKNDRAMREWEGDKDALLGAQLEALRGAGFGLVVQFTQQARYFGVVARAGEAGR